MAERLPPFVLRRRQRGFGVPVAPWLRGPLRGLLQDTLGPERMRGSALLDPAVVDRLVGEHTGGRRNHAKTLWTLLVFELWRERLGLAT